MVPPPARTLVSLDEIRTAVRRVASHVRRTPMIDGFGGFAGVTDAPLFLKCEQMQPCGSFKIRGAANMLEQLSPTARGAGVITYSSGNHGQAVALAARTLGAPAVIVMPTTAPDIKVEAVRRLGAEVIFEGTTSIERKGRAEYEAAARKLTVVPPFDHEWIIAGQATLRARDPRAGAGGGAGARTDRRRRPRGRRGLGDQADTTRRPRRRRGAGRGKRHAAVGRRERAGHDRAQP